MIPRPENRALTLIEVLIVIAIIATLSGLVGVGISIARSRARALQTVQRIDDVLAAFSREGLSTGSIAYAAQRDIAGIGGTPVFARAANASVSLPVGGAAAWHDCFPRANATAPGNPVVPPSGDGAPLIMAYPWGQPRLYPIRESWYTGPLGLPTGLPSTWTAAQRADWEAPEPHRIQELWPGRTADWSAWLRITPDTATWTADRGRGKAWNDAWGHPLVISYALYQPPRCDLGGTPPAPADTYLREAHRLYQTNRILYVAVGAVGPRLDPDRFPLGTLEDAGPRDLRRMWDQITTVCTSGAAWDETAPARAPWRGTRIAVDTGKQVKLTCFLSAPAEFR